MKKILVHISVLLIVFNSKDVFSALEFDLSALELTEGQKSELDRNVLKNVEYDIPGKYLVDVYVNKNNVLNTTITFESCGKFLCPVLTKDFLSSLGVNVSYFNESKKIGSSDEFSLPSAVFPDVTAVYNKQKLRLDLSVPQAAFTNAIRGEIPVTEWDDGIPVIFSSLNGSGQYTNSSNGSGDDTSNYLNINSGINFGPWRVRNQGYYHNGDGVQEWKSIQTYMSRDIKFLRAQVYAGQYSTSGKTLPSFPFKGAMISTDRNMLPDSLKGYAPVIRGIALSQAKVEVRQKGNVIYQAYVSPGAFEITDLYPTAGSGDLDVTVEESDGSQRKFTQPYAASTVMLRRNQFEYTLSGGEYDSSQSGTLQEQFLQGEMLYGLLDSTTVYTGYLASKNYNNTIIGLAQGMGTIGSVSFDLQRSASKWRRNNTEKGKAWQVKYNKVFSETNTSVSMSYLKYMTEGFKTFEQYESLGVDAEEKVTSQYSDIRSRQQFTLSQGFQGLGSISASAFKQKGFKSDSSSYNYNLSYSFNINRVSTSVTWGAYSSGSAGSKENILSLNVSIPLGSSNNNNFAQMNLGTSRSDSGQLQNQVSVSGTMLEANNLSYAVSTSQTKSEASGANTSSQQADIHYRGSKGRVSLGYSQSDTGSKRVNYGFNTSLLAHEYGLTIGQEMSQLNSSAALVMAPGASDVRVLSKQGVRTNSKGFAIVPNLQPYRYNSIQLDSSTLAANAELGKTQLRKVPTQGAVVLAEYQTKIGNKAYLSMTYSGKNIAFGSEVTSKSGASGIIDDRGMAWITGLSDNDSIFVNVAGGQCRAIFNISDFVQTAGIYRGALKCI